MVLNYYYAHFADEKIEVQRAQVTSPRSHSSLSLVSLPGQLDAQSFNLFNSLITTTAEIVHPCL